ncbi:MAG: hypothetical protein ABI627_31955 [Polyangiaceae bacterium]
MAAELHHPLGDVARSPRVSCFQYMGFPDLTSFGDPALNTGEPLPNLTA